MAAALLAPLSASGGADVLDEQTVWRTFRVWRTEVARTDGGELVAVDPWNPRDEVAHDGKVSYHLRTTKKITGTEFPPSDWFKPQFDDSQWDRQPGLWPAPYESLALLCLRGKFTVTDPARAGELALSMTIEGGAIVYLNGREVARCFMPKAATGPDTPAEDYPAQAHVTPDGKALHAGFYNRPKDNPERLAMRPRTVGPISIPVGRLPLVKGVNVLAIEVHRAPAHPAMFTTFTAMDQSASNVNRDAYWWNRCAVKAIRLTGGAPPGAAITPNVARPAGWQVWTHTALEQVTTTDYGDPNETIAPIRLAGARNGVYAGQIVASADVPFTGLTATASALKSDAAEIPATRIQIRYPRENVVHAGRVVTFDALDPGGQPPPARSTFQPIWVSVAVPADAKAGVYSGKITVTADGHPAVDVPLQLRVFNWALPPPGGFRTHVDLIESPDSVAMQYNVAMWSDRHWALLDQAFNLLGQAGNKTVYLPLIRRTHFGNEHGMLRWVRLPGCPADGQRTADFTLVRKYLDLAVKHWGPVPVVVAYLWDINCNPVRGTQPNGTTSTGAESIPISEFDPQTGKWTESTGPKWGSPEARAFWKPVIAELRKILADRKLDTSLHFGLGGDLQPDPAVVADLKGIAPDVPWACHSHFYWETVGRGEQSQKVGYMATIGGCIGVFWNTEDGRPFFGWRNPQLLVTFARDGGGPGVPLWQKGGLAPYRLFAEGCLTSGKLTVGRWGPRKDVASIGGMKDFASFPGLRGIGRVGGDFWEVAKGPRGNSLLAGRYPETGWGTVSLATGSVTYYVIAPGKNGPVSTVRLELMREALQEAEARILVQDALFEPAQRARLGLDLAGRLDDLIDRRTWAFRQISECYSYVPWAYMYLLSPSWQTRSEQLYQAAEDVTARVGH